MDHPTRKSEAIDPGSVIPVSDTGTIVLDADDADLAVKFILINNSDTDMTARLSDAAANVVTGEGILLKASGGFWVEREYAGPVKVKHHGSPGNKNLTRVIV